jgi:hypothetical protein
MPVAFDVTVVIGFDCVLIMIGGWAFNRMKL